MRPQQLLELRVALTQTYQAAGQSPPTYTDDPPTLMRAVHFNELRLAIRGLQ